jgi:hypothetical protein
MLQDSVISAMIEGANYDSDSSSSLKEQVLRLQSLIAYLLQKNEELRLTVEVQFGKDDRQTIKTV